MPPQVTTQPPAPLAPQGDSSAADRHIIELIAAALAARAGTDATMSAIIAILTAAAIPLRAAQAAASITVRLALGPAVTGAATAAERVAAPAWRAAFTLASARRIAAGLRNGDDVATLLPRERLYLRAHKAAQQRRYDAAGAVDLAAQTLGGLLLGWSAMHDPKTTPECRWADGKNFYADQRPAFGWPGAVHGSCRCIAVPPWPNGRLLYGDAPTRLMKGH